MTGAPIRAALFDLDGTILNTPPAIAEAMASAVADVTGKTVPLARIKPLIGRPLAAICAALISQEERDPLTLAVVDAYRRRYRRDIVPNASRLVFEGVTAGLAAIRAAGVPTAVVTSKDHTAAELILHAAGIHRLFAFIVGANDVRAPKPDPEAGRRALSLLDVDNEHAVMIGDTADDVMMGHAIPVRTIGVTYGVAGRQAIEALSPTWVVSQFSEIADLITSRTDSKSEVLL